MGIWTLYNQPIDAIPDLSDTQVIIYSRWDRSPDIVEDQVTYPITTALLGAPKVKAIRGYSDFGFSYVRELENMVERLVVFNQSGPAKNEGDGKDEALPALLDLPGELNIKQPLVAYPTEAASGGSRRQLERAPERFKNRRLVTVKMHMALFLLNVPWVC